jgi:hypothetical protein
MAQATQAVLKLSREELLTQRLLLTGEAAGRVDPGMDRRTFKAWAKKAGVEVAYILVGGREAYHEADVDKVARFYKKEKAGKK